MFTMDTRLGICMISRKTNVMIDDIYIQNKTIKNIIFPYHSLNINLILTTEHHPNTLVCLCVCVCIYIETCIAQQLL